MASFDDFKNVVINIDTRPPSTSGKLAPSFNVSVAENWIKNPKNPLGNTRTLGYLAGYIKVAGEDFFPANGIPLKTRTLHLDKSVISDLLYAELITLKNDIFYLTDEGNNYLGSKGKQLRNKKGERRNSESNWRKYRDLLQNKGDVLISEYRALVRLGFDKYIVDRGLVPKNKSKTYFFNLGGNYVDMKAPVRVVLRNSERPASFQSKYIYKALKNLGYDVRHDVSATGGVPLDGNVEEREPARYLALARPQQAKFRKSVSKLFNHKCWATNCEIVQALEAAHITPYSQCTEDPKGDHVSNGLYLRRDLHALFDAGLLSFGLSDVASEYTIYIAKNARDGAYANLHGRKLKYPSKAHYQVARVRLETHFKKRK